MRGALQRLDPRELADIGRTEAERRSECVKCLFAGSGDAMMLSGYIGGDSEFDNPLPARYAPTAGSR